MASNLYEILGVTKDATTEQIRKAYKQMALKTHPDKLPPGLSEEEKAVAAEKFREVSHACEVLADPERRKEYDIHGVWPPPELEEDIFDVPLNEFPRHRPARGGRGGRGFDSPFNAHHRHRSHSHFAFRDPFELFDAIFRDFEDIFRPPAFTPFDPFNTSGSMRPRGMFHDPLFSPAFPSPPTIPPMFMGPLFPTLEASRGPRGHHTQSERFISHTVNGVTLSTHTRRDQNGNEHVTRKYPDGREVYTVNGVEQPARGYLPRSGPELGPMPSTLPQPRTTFPHPLGGHHQRTPTPQQSSRHAAHSPPGQRYRATPPSFCEGSGPYLAYNEPSGRPLHRESLRDRLNPNAYRNTRTGGGTQKRSTRYPTRP